MHKLNLEKYTMKQKSNWNILAEKFYMYKYMFMNINDPHYFRYVVLNLMIEII
jgi:hypothetical protein